MKERPIIFSAAMVLAILSGRKTQTRRLHANPRYAVGDQAWVRETWRPFSWTRDGSPFTIQYRADMATVLESAPDTLKYEDWSVSLWVDVSVECHAAGCKTDDEGNYRWKPGEGAPTKWRPSIFMPRWVSRIPLEVTGVRRELVQDISEADEEAEGCSWGMFRKLWNSMYAPHHCHDWAANPLVWVYEFRRVT